MFGIDDALLGAGVSAAASYFGQQSTNDTNVNLALSQQAYNTQMANTAHQREVSDLIAAGLNPILSVNRSGAPMPQSTMPTLVNPMAHATSSAVDAYKGIQEVHKSRAEQAKVEQEVRTGKAKETGMGLVNTGLEAIKPAVEAAVTSALDAVAPVKAAAEKVAESVSTAAATVKETAQRYGVAISDVLTAPGKFVASTVNSAVDARDRVQAVRKRVAAEGPELTPRQRAALPRSQGGGRRLGTLGGQPRYVPQYGVGD